MLFLHPVICHVLGLKRIFTGSFVLHLPVELLLDKSLALSFPDLLLLLLLVVQQRVEFLDGEPLVLFINFRVDVGLLGFRR